MPVDRDNEDERGARIEQMLKGLQRELQLASAAHRTLIVDARLARERSEAARAGTRKSRLAVHRAPKSRKRL